MSASSSSSRIRYSTPVKWHYLLPVLGAPVAHWIVSFSANRSPIWRKRLWIAAGIATVSAVVTRLVLMEDSGIMSAKHPQRKAAEISS